jgi:hypothetical protein
MESNNLVNELESCPNDVLNAIMSYIADLLPLLYLNIRFYTLVSLHPNFAPWIRGRGCDRITALCKFGSACHADLLQRCVLSEKHIINMCAYGNLSLLRCILTKINLPNYKICPWFDDVSVNRLICVSLKCNRFNIVKHLISNFTIDIKAFYAVPWLRGIEIRMLLNPIAKKIIECPSIISWIGVLFTDETDINILIGRVLRFCSLDNIKIIVAAFLKCFANIDLSINCMFYLSVRMVKESDEETVRLVKKIMIDMWPRLAQSPVYFRDEMIEEALETVEVELIDDIVPEEKWDGYPDINPGSSC